MNNPLDKWKGQFGNDYSDRNQTTPEMLNSRRNLWMNLFQTMGYTPKSILEVGAGNGQNLIAIKDVFNVLGQKSPIKCDFHAVEPNSESRARLEADCPWVKSYNADINDLPQNASSIEFVFTSGVLIHIPPGELDKAMGEIYRVSSKSIFCLEYFAPSCEEIKYRDQSGMLWRNDFGRLYVEKFKLRVVGYGFCWKLITGLDNLTWTLLEKTH